MAVTIAGRWTITLITTACILAAFAIAGLYRPRLHASVLDDAARIVAAAAVAWAVVGWIGPPLPAPGSVPYASAWWWLPVAAAVVAARLLGHAALRRRRRRGPVPTVIVGAGPMGVRVAAALLAHPECGVRPIGFIGTPSGTSARSAPVPVLGPLDTLGEAVEEHGARAVVVAFLDLPEDDDLVESLREFRQRGNSVLLVPRLSELDVECVGAEVVGGVPLVRMRPFGKQRWEWRVKRLIDVVGAVSALVVLSPVLLACAVAVRLEVGRAGILFRQERVGPDRVRFQMLKFRSLIPTSPSEAGDLWDVNGDRRVGPVGRFIRRTSLDELPQLVNVLRGEMSLVGPRPERPFFVEKFGRQHRHYLQRHRVPGGMTGWAQVHKLRGDTSIPERIAYDNYYIENWSLGLDLKILVRTIGVVIGSLARRRAGASVQREPLRRTGSTP